MKVRTFRLVNGDVLIADEYKEEDAEQLHFKDAAIIFLKSTNDGKTDGVMAPYMPFAKDGRISVYKHTLAAECEPADKLVDEYKRLFGLGLEILTKEQADSVLKQSKAVEKQLQ